MKIDRRQIRWALQRMARIIMIWRKLDAVDRRFLFDKFCDEYPQEFWQIVREKRP